MNARLARVRLMPTPAARREQRITLGPPAAWPKAAMVAAARVLVQTRADFVEVERAGVGDSRESNRTAGSRTPV